MDELFAIIIIVVLCCVMFFAWLVSMATCPDAMVSFLSGQRPDSNYSSSHESKELIRSEEEDGKEMVKSVSAVFVQMNSARRTSDKKLSVVPEQDEQLTVQSTIHSMRPSILRLTSPPRANEAIAMVPSAKETIDEHPSVAPSQEELLNIV